MPREAVAEPVARLAAASGWPVLAEPTSGVRCGDHDRSHVVAHYDVLLRAPGFASSHSPALVLRVGDLPTSKPLRAWLEAPEQVVLDPHPSWNEPTRRAALLLHAAPATTCDALAAALEMRTMEHDPAWLSSWRAAEAEVPAALAAAPDPFEPKAIAAVEPALGDGALVWVSSSMPVRDLEAYFPQSAKRVRFLANRGANGIDGTVSAAAGAARATGAPTLLITGELALLHDLGGLLAARRAGIELSVLCLNNGGGGIFDFLPVAESAEAAHYEEHVATPAGVDLADVARLAGLEHRDRGARRARSPAALAAGPALVEVRTDRAQNVRAHRETAERVAASVGA